MNKVINLNTLGNLISVIKLKEIWIIDELLEKANINYDDLIYFLNILSEIYFQNGEYLFDFELDSINNKVVFNNSTEFYNLETITDLELFKIYTLLNNIDVELTFKNISKQDFKMFNNTLKKSFNLYNFENNRTNNNKKITLNKNTFIEYIRLGDTEPEIYEIEPLIITSNNDGSVLEAVDINEDKVKTFLINRIITVDNKIKKINKSKQKNKEIDVTFKLIDENLLKKIDNYKYIKKNNEYLSIFRNKNIAIEFFLENFNAAKVISPDVVKVDIMKRIKSIQKLIAE